MLRRREVIPSIVRAALLMPNRIAHALIIKDLNTWLRLEFLGVLATTGLADALRAPRTIDELLHETGLTDRALLEALLAVGTSLREVRVRGGRYSARGRRTRAVVGTAEDLRGFVEELAAYDSVVYTALGSHLGGLPPAPYDTECGTAIAMASRVAEPILGPVVRAITRRLQPARVLDIGCGSGAYLRHMLDEAPDAAGVGVDRSADAVEAATALLDASGLRQRCHLHHGDIGDLATELGRFPLVALLNNIYYWAPEQRVGVFRTIREILTPQGTLVVATATSRGQAYSRHLDLVLRVTAGCHPLPTRRELLADLENAGFVNVSIVEPVPATGLLVATAHTP